LLFNAKTENRHCILFKNNNIFTSALEKKFMTEQPDSFSQTRISSHKTKKIFLVDDDLDDQELFIDAIQSINANIKVITQTNGNKAIQHLLELGDKELPDLIVLDYNLPEFDGSQILEALSNHARFDAIPKVVWSTSGSGLFEPKCMALGAKAYLIKPSDLSGINKLAKQLIALCLKEEEFI
jgi:CheY-like chemotaxis protein